MPNGRGILPSFKAKNRRNTGDFLTRQVGKRPGQMVFNAYEYGFLSTLICDEYSVLPQFFNLPPQLHNFKI